MPKSLKKYKKYSKHIKHSKHVKRSKKVKSSKKVKRSRHTKLIKFFKSKKNKTFRKNKRTKRYKKKNLKGGNFKLSQLGAPWNPYDGGKYFKLSKCGIDVGGIDPYFGTSQQSQQSQQSGGNILSSLYPQALTNDIRVAENNFDNAINMYKGKKLIPSPLPWKDQYIN